MAIRDHHRALKTEVVSKTNAGHIEIVLAKLQWGKQDSALTLHVNPTSFTTAGLQTTDWLAFLGFQRSDSCAFTSFRRCYSKDVPEDFDVGAFATAFNSGFGHLEAAQRGLAACGFALPQPEGWGFFQGTASREGRRGYAEMSGDGHTAVKTNQMKATEDDKFFFRFTFIDVGPEKAFVTHYRPKHPPLSSELRSAFQYLGLKEFNDCPEFEFDPCYFKTRLYVVRGDDPWSGNTEVAHGAFDAHATQFSPAIENLLAANAVAESVGLTFLPFDRPTARMNADIASHIGLAEKRSSTRKPEAISRAPTALPDRFDVAISFAGTERANAEKLAELLRGAGYTVFYDNHYPEHLWGKNLPVFFDEIFRKRARFCVMFVSKEYRDRKWTALEARSALARALEEKGNEYILPIRVDATELEGLLPTVGYVQISAGIDAIADLLLKKLRSP